MIATLLALALAGPPLAPCTALAVRLDSRNGEFDGMSHSGVAVELRNTGARACTVDGLPTLIFMGPGGRRLDIVRRAPAGMHPSPVVTPVTLAPGQEASTALRWTSGAVDPGGRCVSPPWLSVQTAARRVNARFHGQLCGPAGASVPFDQPPLTVDRR